MSKEGQERSKRGWSNLDRFRSQNAHLHGGKPKRKVIGLHDDGRLIVFPSIEEAARWRKGHPADVRRCCLDNRSLAVNKRNGKVNTNHKYLGMRFYYEDDIDIWKNKIN